MEKNLDNITRRRWQK